MLGVIPLLLSMLAPLPSECRAAPRVQRILDEIVAAHGVRMPGFAGGYERKLVELLGSPRDSACNLIAGLHPVGVRFISGYEPPPDKEALMVVWRIRALRYLTGCLDMKAPTGESPSHPEEEGSYFLELKGKERLPFFAVWMSRDATFLAPIDTQAAVAEQWRRWFAENGGRFQYHACKAVEDWYF